MNIHPYKAIIIIFALCVQTISRPASAADVNSGITEQNIQALIEAVDGAAMRGDVSGYASYYSDDYVIRARGPGPSGPKTIRMTRDEYLASVEQSFRRNSNYRNSHDRVKISIAADGRSATFSGTQIETWTSQANDIRSISTEEHKLELRQGKLLIVNSYIEVLEQKASPNAASTSVNAADVPFSDADFSAYAGEGPATLEGEAFIRTQGGELRYCAGETVLLAPATQYDLNVIKAFGFGRDVAMKRAGPAAKYWQETVCDSQGKFTFENLPFGTWVVITDVRYNASGARIIGGEQQGGLMAKKVNVRNKKSKVIMNEQTLFSNSLFGVGWPN